MKLPPFQALLDEHRADVYRFLVATVGPSDADDCFQETWISALRAYPTLRRGDNLRAWLFRIAQNKSIDAHRARGRRAVPVATVPERPTSSPSDADPELWERVRDLPDQATHSRVLPLGARNAVRRAGSAAREQRGRGTPQRPRGTEAAQRGVELMNDIEMTLKNAALDLPTDTPELADRAEAEGLIDVAYTSVDSPLGPLVVAATPEGLVRVSYTEFRGEDEVLEELARRVSPRVLEAPARLDPVRRELDEYFEGRRQDFEVPIDWSYLAGFTREVLRATARIGFGEVSTYAGVAAEAGSPRAVRAAGNALGANPMPVVVPCHRVLRSGGKLGGYTGGLERKEFLLRLEGALL